MKRTIQLVVLFVAALLVAQPLMGFAACSGQICTGSGSGCASICCAGMAGNTAMSGQQELQVNAGCQAPMGIAPADSECEPQPAHMVASAPTDTASVAPDSQSRIDSAGQFLQVAASSGQIVLNRAAGWQPDSGSVTQHKYILFQVFRI